MSRKWIPPRSPYNLIQEKLWSDPWKIFVACIFCNLTKRNDAEPYMWKFFDLYPTPSAASLADLNKVENLIQPLGLSKKRSKALVKMSNDYINKDWKSNPELLYGVGKYASDAYHIFCVGNWKKIEPKDHALNDYHEFLKKKFKNMSLGVQNNK